MLIDTSGLLCFPHAAELQHREAVTFFHVAYVRITHNYVVAEFIALAEKRHLPRQAVLKFIADLQDNPMVEIVYIDKTLHQVVLTLLQQRLDKAYSLCDAVSFVLMRERGITEALTTDHHFEQEGFTRLLKP